MLVAGEAEWHGSESYLKGGRLAHEILNSWGLVFFFFSPSKHFVQNVWLGFSLSKKAHLRNVVSFCIILNRNIYICQIKNVSFVVSLRSVVFAERVQFLMGENI